MLEQWNVAIMQPELFAQDSISYMFEINLLQLTRLSDIYIFQVYVVEKEYSRELYILTFHLDEVEVVDSPNNGRIVQCQIDNWRDPRRRIGHLLVPRHVGVRYAVDKHRSDL